MEVDYYTRLVFAKFKSIPKFFGLVKLKPNTMRTFFEFTPIPFEFFFLSPNPVYSSLIIIYKFFRFRLTFVYSVLTRVIQGKCKFRRQVKNFREEMLENLKCQQKC